MRVTHLAFNVEGGVPNGKGDTMKQCLSVLAQEGYLFVVVVVPPRGLEVPELARIVVGVVVPSLTLARRVPSRQEAAVSAAASAQPGSRERRAAAGVRHVDRVRSVFFRYVLCRFPRARLSEFKHEIGFQ